MLLMLLLMIHRQRTLVRLGRFIRFPPWRLAAGAGSTLLQVGVMGFLSTGACEMFGPGGLLHGAGTAGEFGADVGGEEGDEEREFAEEGL